MSDKAGKLNADLLEQAIIGESAEEKQAILDELERTYWIRTLTRVVRDWRLYALLLPLVLIFLFWRYFPLYGLVGAFKDNGVKVIWERDFVGLQWFKVLLLGEQKIQFWSAFRNTFLISFYGLMFGFPIPIILALFFNEVKSNIVRSGLQIAVYLPKFVSLVVITSLVTLLLKTGAEGNAPGVVARFLSWIGVVNAEHAVRGMLLYPQYFRAIYLVSGIWETAGYDSIVFFAAIIAISPTSYEAAEIDGASKLQQLRYVVLPGMASTIIIMLILRVGSLLNVGYEKVILLYNGYTYGTADVVSSLVSRLSGVGSDGAGANQAIGSAADLMAALMSMILVIGANVVSRKTSETTLY